MTELVCLCLGAGVVAVCWGFQAWSNRTEYRELQEKDYAEVQGKVDEIVTILERMVYRPRN